MRICIGGGFCFNYSFAPQEGQNFALSSIGAPQLGHFAMMIISFYILKFMGLG